LATASSTSKDKLRVFVRKKTGICSLLVLEDIAATRAGFWSLKPEDVISTVELTNFKGIIEQDR